MTSAEFKLKLAKECEKRREAQRLCAGDFLMFGDKHGQHALRCVYAGTETPTCDKDYDPGPAPADIKLYEGTTLGALWGLATQPEGAIARLNALRTGWNIKERKPA